MTSEGEESASDRSPRETLEGRTDVTAGGRKSGSQLLRVGDEPRLSRSSVHRVKVLKVDIDTVESVLDDPVGNLVRLDDGIGARSRRHLSGSKSCERTASQRRVEISSESRRTRNHDLDASLGVVRLDSRALSRRQPGPSCSHVGGSIDEEAESEIRVSDESQDETLGARTHNPRLKMVKPEI